MNRFFGAITHYFSIYKKYLGNRLYIVFGLTLLASATEGLGIAMLLPLVLLLDINLGNPTEAISQATGFERLLQDVVILLGIDDSIIGILIFISFIFVFKGALKFYEQAYKFYLRAELMREIRIKLFDQYSTMTYQYYNQHNAGHFINLVSIRKMLG